MIDAVFDATAGESSVAGVPITLKATTVGAEGGAIDGYRALASAVLIAEMINSELAAIMARHGESRSPPA